MNVRDILFLALLVSSGVVRPVGAQIVADGAIHTLSSVTNTVTGDVTVGTNGSSTVLVLSEHALLTNSANGLIGRNAPARSNEVQVVSPSARWLMGGTLFVGSNGAFSTLVVSNGGLVRANAGIIGRQTASDSNRVLVTGPGSMWSNVAGVGGVGLTVGSLGSGNQLIVSNGGWVVNTGGSGSIGSNGSNNLARVTGAGSVWSNRFGLNINPIGAGNANNGLVIEDGGQVFNDDGLINGLNGSSNNFAFITGSGSVWNNSRDLFFGSSVRSALIVSNGGTVLSANSYVGSGGSLMLVTGGGSQWSHQHDLALSGRNNTLVVADGGSVLNSNGYVGGLSGGDVSASNNLVLVTGSGSTWSNRADLVVGFAGPRNHLVVSNGATVTASNLLVGFHPNSLDNRVTVDSGALQVTNVAGNGTLDVRRGTNRLNAGLIEVDRLLVTNSSGRLVFNGGTLAAGASRISNGQLFRVGNTVSPATFNLTGNGAHSFPDGLTISAFATLLGNGAVSGPVTVQPAAILAPGASVGKIILSNTPSLQGNIRMEVSKAGGVLTNDQIEVAGVLALLTITYSGSLTVTNISTNALAAGDRFKLFNAATYNGSFLAITLPPLNPRLRWLNNLLVDGSIEVESLAPAVQTLPATFLTLNGATLNAVANPKTNATLAWFEYGFTTNYGSVTAPQPLGSGASNTHFSQVLPGLFGGVTYHFRAVASNSFGVGLGGDQTFALPAFADIGAGLPGVDATQLDFFYSFGFTPWGDYDNDGRLDLLLAGHGIVQIWRNIGASFTHNGFFIPGLSGCSAAWGDLDNDGRLDLVVTGRASFSSAAAFVLRNTGNGFSDMNTNENALLFGVHAGAAVLGDYDQDGLLDILTTGDIGTGPFTDVWRNTWDPLESTCRHASLSIL